MSVFVTDLADVLRAGGLAVVEVAGWQTRGWAGGPWNTGGGLKGAPRGGLTHHTATAASAPGNYPTLTIVRDGRAGLPGPLAQLGLGRDGTWYVIAAGLANHAGAVDDPAFGNAYALGVEAENPGNGAPWPPEQYAAYVRGCAALGARYGISWRAHREAAVPKGRKTDPSFDMAAFRAAVAGTGPAVAAVSNSLPPVAALAPAAPAPVPAGGVAVDGDFGPATKRALQRDLGVGADGDFGRLSTQALQRRLGAGADGVWGRLTTVALQRRLGVTADGVFGPVSVRALQRRLNAGSL